MASDEKSFPDLLGISVDDLTHLVESSASLRGILIGYVAELQPEKKFFRLSDKITYVAKADDHDRSRMGDRTLVYGGVELVVEVKSLQTNSVTSDKNEETGETCWRGRAQVDASDRRPVTFPDGSRLENTPVARAVRFARG